MMTIERRPSISTLIDEMPANERALMARPSFILIIWPKDHKQIAAARRLVTKGLLIESPVCGVAFSYVQTPRGQRVSKRLGYGVHS